MQPPEGSAGGVRGTGAGLSFADQIRGWAKELGFSAVGITSAADSGHIDRYRGWIASGRHGSMDYLSRPESIARRERPGELHGVTARTVIVVGHPYAGDDPAGVPEDPSVGVIARYARGRDYHNVLRKRLHRLLSRIESEARSQGLAPTVTGAVHVDAGPVLERELAGRAGLGWFGRNTMLIDPRRGSYLLLGTLMLDLELPPDAPFTEDRCGSCSACIPACPTGALEGRNEAGAPVLDARKCISYWTIETDASIPVPIREAMGNRIFGCDICQEVCPWNRFADPVGDPAYAARGPGLPPEGVEVLPEEAGLIHPGTTAPALTDLFAMTEHEWRGWSRGAPLRRAGYGGFRRSVAVALGNWLAARGAAAETELAAQAIRLLRKAAESDPSKVVREHAAWALQRGSVGL